MGISGNMTVRYLKGEEGSSWDRYVLSHPGANLYHLSGWQSVIEKTYGHRGYRLAAVLGDEKGGVGAASKGKGEPVIAGVLPLVHVKHFLFGNDLFSLPFFDMGGILADDEAVERALVMAAVSLGQRLGVNGIELRHLHPLKWMEACTLTGASFHRELHARGLTGASRLHKVRMLKALPDSSERLMGSFKSKLRSQIRKPLKEGLAPRIGGLELLEDFYRVFSVNMRDLGSPVHSPAMVENVLRQFPERSRIIMIYKGSEPVACALVMGFADTLENPWASSLRRYARMSPNMLLYWTMLEYALGEGFSYFDFGRSTPGDGTYRFKEQWGARPAWLHWHVIIKGGDRFEVEQISSAGRRNATRLWKKLPVPITRVIGPKIRKYIGL